MADTSMTRQMIDRMKHIQEFCEAAEHRVQTLHKHRAMDAKGTKTKAVTVNAHSTEAVAVGAYQGAPSVEADGGRPRGGVGDERRCVEPVPQQQ